jgi:hypothetical protein
VLLELTRRDLKRESLKEKQGQDQVITISLLKKVLQQKLAKLKKVK